ncbi:MAG TPA: TIGR03016 family PEP-CTERM system-associated outer membrane protein, partial [Verrucomicrobiae bacterium]|nr:TIGR03016 family PEP-CTERM system-associated outer membrane protein [Verrucomicrobiae bacterium]
MKTRLVHAALGASLLAGVSPAGAGETAFKPFLGIAEEFTDNVENIDKARRHDFITRVTPGFSGRYRSSLWDWNGSFMLDYRYYARNSRSEDTTSVVDLKGKVAVVENLLFLEVSDVYKRVSLDVARDFTQESLFRNQADTNVVTVSPYVLVRWKERTELRAGYRFEDIRYFSANVTVPEETPVEVRNRTDHTVFAGISHALTPRSSLTADYSFRRELISSRDNVLHVALLGWEGKYGEKSGIKLQAGYGRLEFDGPREGGASLTWNAELKHEAGPMKYLLSSGVNYIPDPLGGAARETRYRGEVVRATERNTVSV